ncbi:hypothetical protein [Hymenobacter koreensis]|uniref:Lipoprotein n=1 Tax=Hymenobacter koreensis TaxID=1084523 RepID=A0ABP8IUV2_9BACT
MKLRFVMVVGSSLLAACGSNDQPAAQTPALPDTEAGRSVADARHLPAPSGDPQDDAPSADVPPGPTPMQRQAGAAVQLTADSQPWVADSLLAQSGPGLLGDYEEVTLRVRAGTPVKDVFFSELVLRLPLTPEIIAHVPVAIPLDQGLRAEFLAWSRRRGSGPPLFDAAARQAGLHQDYGEAPMAAPKGTFTLQTLDRAGRVFSGQLDVTFTTNPDGPDSRPVRLQGQLTDVRY